MADVIGDRLFLTLVLNFFTVVFIYVVSSSDWRASFRHATVITAPPTHGLLVLGFLGLATLNFCFALILLYLANVWFGTSIGAPHGSEIRRPAVEHRRARVG